MAVVHYTPYSTLHTYIEYPMVNGESELPNANSISKATAFNIFNTFKASKAHLRSQPSLFS